MSVDPMITRTLAPDQDAAVTIHQALQTPRVGVQLRAYQWDQPSDESGVILSHCYLDLSLTARPGDARGWYQGRWRRGRSEPIGDVMFLPPSLEFRGSHGPGRQTSLTLLLAPDLFGLELADLHDAVLAEGLHLSDDAVRRALWRLAAEVRRPWLTSPLAMETAAILIAGRLERHLLRTAANDGLKRGGLPPARLALIEDRIRADLPAPSIAELAQLCRLSPRHLARAYREETGQSLGRRVAVANLQRAWRLLTETTRSVKEIAVDLGFCSSASFCAAFRSATGLRPSDVRLDEARCA